MQIEQRRWSPAAGWTVIRAAQLSRADLVLVFGARVALESRGVVGEVRASYPGARIVGCSTAGEICGTQVTDDSVVTTAISFESSRIDGAQVRFRDCSTSREAGERLAGALPPEGLVHALVLSDGLEVNGSELVEGMLSRLSKGVTITGGLAGDGERFERTLVFLDHEPGEPRIVAVGFYGSRLKIGYGSLGGWDPFGPERIVTKSRGNVLYELDGKPALALYKKYLGEYAAGLPATGLLFPLSVRSDDTQTGIVRTILGTDEAEGSLRFAGDVPEGWNARLMKANFERLIDGAMGAARACEPLASSPPDLAVLISCVGRKLVLKQRVEEETEGVRDVLGPGAAFAGFYSYGEICPFLHEATCELHNQTMTITTFSER